MFPSRWSTFLWHFFTFGTTVTQSLFILTTKSQRIGFYLATTIIETKNRDVFGNCNSYSSSSSWRAITISVSTSSRFLWRYSLVDPLAKWTLTTNSSPSLIISILQTYTIIFHYESSGDIYIFKYGRISIIKSIKSLFILPTLYFQNMVKTTFWKFVKIVFDNRR